MRDMSEILMDTRIQTRSRFLNGYQGFLQLRGGNRRTFVYCATKDVDEDETYEHVSVSVANSRTKTPTWEEMCEVKDLFWRPDEEVHEVHPAADDYVHGVGGLENVLHLWRPASGWKW